MCKGNWKDVHQSVEYTYIWTIKQHTFFMFPFVFFVFLNSYCKHIPLF